MRSLTDAIEPVRALPGVRCVTPIAAVPFSGFNVPPIAVPAGREPPDVNGQLPFLIAATPEFFDILGMRIVEGRQLTAADERGAPVVVVNETMARTVWPGEAQSASASASASIPTSIPRPRPGRRALGRKSRAAKSSASPATCASDRCCRPAARSG